MKTIFNVSLIFLIAFTTSRPALSDAPAALTTQAISQVSDFADRKKDVASALEAELTDARLAAKKIDKKYVLQIDPQARIEALEQKLTDLGVPTAEIETHIEGVKNVWTALESASKLGIEKDRTAQLGVAGAWITNVASRSQEIRETAKQIQLGVAQIATNNNGNGGGNGDGNNQNQNVAENAQQPYGGGQGAGGGGGGGSQSGQSGSKQALQAAAVPMPSAVKVATVPVAGSAPVPKELAAGSKDIQNVYAQGRAALANLFGGAKTDVNSPAITPIRKGVVTSENPLENKTASQLVSNSGNSGSGLGLTAPAINSLASGSTSGIRNTLGGSEDTSADYYAERALSSVEESKPYSTAIEGSSSVVAKPTMGLTGGHKLR